MKGKRKLRALVKLDMTPLINHKVDIKFVYQRIQELGNSLALLDKRVEKLEDETLKT